MSIVDFFSRPRRLGQAGALLLFGAVLLQTAWLAEDAFVTFRTVDNFVHGYGLTWNVAERVQAYSNPLWMLLVIPFYWLSGEIYYTAIALSMGVSLAAVFVLCARFAVSGRSALLAATVLVCSKAFTDYSTVGLENPLTHLLLALFYVVFFDRRQDRGYLFWLALLAALAAVNRLDAIILYAPSLAYVLWNHRGWRAIRDCCLGFTPLVLWEAFSLFYYGFPFPNTAYAKLGTGVPLADRLTRGIDYLYNSLSIDPLTLAVVSVAVAVVGRGRDRGAGSLAAGLILYLAYTVFIGGDFMSGRFLTAPFWGSVLLFFHSVDVRRPAIWAAVFCSSVLASSLSPYTPFFSGAGYAPERMDEHMDERGKYYRSTGLLQALKKAEGVLFPDHWWAVRGRAVRRGDLQPEVQPGFGEGKLIAPAMYDSVIVAAWMNIGLSGFYAGPKVYIVDAIGLSDPLMARLPAREDPNTSAGHFGRIMPAGYLETVITGTNQFADIRLGAYYDALLIVVRGELLSVRRLVEIWKLNTGVYEELIDQDFFRHPSELELALSEVRMEPRNPTNYLRAAWGHFKLGQDERAFSALNDAVNLNPTSFTNFVLIGDMLDVREHQDLATKAYRQAIDNSEAYLQRLEAEENEEGLFRAYRELAKIHIWLGDRGFEEVVAAIYLEIIARDFAAADSALYRQIGDYFAALGMEAESAESHRRAGGKR